MRKASFFISITILLLGVISFYLSLISITYSYEDIARLRDIGFNNAPYSEAAEVTKLQYFVAQATSILLFGAVCFILLYSYYSRQNIIHNELLTLRQEAQRAVHDLLTTWRKLPSIQRATVILLLIIVLTTRTFYLISYPLGEDELHSYHFFASKGILYVSSYYPIPNNHVLYNTISYFADKISHDFYWAGRGPTFSIGVVATVVTYLLLLRSTNFTVATLATFLFCFSPYGLEYSFVGRGYFLLFSFAILGFFSTVGLIASHQRARLYWFMLIATSIAGIYTIPTYLYPFCSALVVLATCFVWRRQWSAVVSLFAATCIVTICSFLLYAPILWVSGLQSMIGNNYVSPLTNNFSWQLFFPYYHSLEGLIVGQDRLGIWVNLLPIAALLITVYNFNYKIGNKVAGPMLAYVFIPFIVVAAQRVFAPARAISYRLFFIFIAIGILYDFIQDTKLKLSTKSNTIVISALIVLYGVYQIFYLERRIIPFRVKSQQLSTAYQWLAARKPHAILVQAESYPLFLYHYAHQHNTPIVINTEAQPGTVYDYSIVQASKPTPIQATPFEVYTNGVVHIFSRTRE